MIQNPMVVKRGGTSFEGFKKVDSWDEFNDLFLEDEADTGFILLHDTYNDNSFALWYTPSANVFDMLTINVEYETFPFVTKYLYSAYGINSGECSVYANFMQGEGYFGITILDGGDDIRLFTTGETGNGITVEYYVKA